MQRCGFCKGRKAGKKTLGKPLDMMKEMTKNDDIGRALVNKFVAFVPPPNRLTGFVCTLDEPFVVAKVSAVNDNLDGDWLLCLEPWQTCASRGNKTKLNCFPAAKVVKGIVDKAKQLKRPLCESERSAILKAVTARKEKLEYCRADSWFWHPKTSDLLKIEGIIKILGASGVKGRYISEKTLEDLLTAKVDIVNVGETASGTLIKRLLNFERPQGLADADAEGAGDDVDSGSSAGELSEAGEEKNKNEHDVVERTWAPPEVDDKLNGIVLTDVTFGDKAVVPDMGEEGGEVLNDSEGEEEGHAHVKLASDSDNDADDEFDEA
jgi:hypothetical protein